MANTEQMRENDWVMEEIGKANDRAEAAERERDAVFAASTELVNMVAVLRERVRALTEALEEEWLSNHSEHCMFKWPHDGQCHWLRPAALASSPAEEEK